MSSVMITEALAVPASDCLLPLNRSEHLYWAGEGLFGPVNQPYLLRFDGPVDEALVRRTLRSLLSAFPRLRGVLHPGVVRHQLRILPDDAHLDLLFDDAYRLQPGVDPSDAAALEAFHGPFLNEPMPLERGLPWRARFFPHPSQPALMFSVHHIVGDGRSMVQLLCAIMAGLNGRPITPCPLESPSMLPAVLPRRWQDWPTSIAAWWRALQADKRAARGQRVLSLATHRSTEFAPSTVRHHVLDTSAKALRELSKALNTSSNTLLTALMAQTFLAMAPHDPQAVAAIRISVDLRRYFPEGQAPQFGNHVATFVVRATHQPDLAAQIASLDAQVKAGLARFERREHALPLLLYEWLPLIGRTLYSRILLQAKRQGSLEQVSAHFTNLGPAEFIHPEGAQLKLTEMWPATNGTGLLIGALSLNGRQLLSIIHPRDEYPSEAVERFVRDLGEQLHQLQGAVALRAAA